MKKHESVPLSNSRRSLSKVECSVHDAAYCMLWTSDGSVVSFQKTAVAVLASVVVFFKTAVAVLMRLC